MKKYIELEEMKRLELDILKAFIAYCERYGLRYFLYSGTLLGAMRHKGFIPWDDDIDLAMPRPDLERLTELVKEHPVGEYYKLYHCYDEDTDYFPTVAKIADERTAGDEIYQGRGVHNGVWIDLFPIDGVPDSPEEREKLFQKMNREYKRLTMETLPFVFTKHPLKLIKRLLVWPVYLFGHRKNHRIRSRRINEWAKAYPYESCDLVCVDVTGLALERKVIEKRVAEELTLHPFEDIQALVPVESDAYLRKLYGDYMQLPPPSQRVPLHQCRCWWKE